MADQLPALAPDTAVLAAISKAELDQQITTAHAFPRSIQHFLRDATDLASLSVDVAEECIYAVPRENKMIRGPSARLAEILHSQYRNCRVSAQIIAEDDQYVTARGIFHDLETNAATAIDTKRRIADKRGRKYSLDMIITTANAACSIARRNAILAGIPKAIWLAVYNAAEQTIAGDARPLGERRDKALAHFKRLGVAPERVFQTLGVGGLEDLGSDELLTLQGLKQGIKDGELSIEAAFPPLRPHVAPGATRGEEIKTLLAGTSSTPEASPPAAEAPAEPELDLERVDTETGEVLGIADERARPPE